MTTSTFSGQFSAGFECCPPRLPGDHSIGNEDGSVRVVKIQDGGVVGKVRLPDDDGCAIDAPCQFLEHQGDRRSSPNTLCAYGYDLKRLFRFLHNEELDWREFGPADALRFLGYLRKLPSKRAAQRIRMTVVVGGDSMPGTLLSPAVNRVLAAASSFYDWAIATEVYTRGESPFQVRDDHALARVPDRHRPYMGKASRRRPVRRIASVRQPIRLPRPMSDADLEAFLSSLSRLRGLAIFLLMLDGCALVRCSRCRSTTSPTGGDASWSARVTTIRAASGASHGPNASWTCTNHARWKR